MGILDRLPTVADMAAARAGKPFPKGASPSRLQAKEARDKDDDKKLAVWRDEVFDRDERKCRCCGLKVLRLQIKILHPRRAEAHHVAGRDDQAVRYDVRNGLTLCLKCHERVTGVVNDKLRIVGTVWFIKGGQRYINAQFPVTFVKVA